MFCFNNFNGMKEILIESTATLAKYFSRPNSTQHGQVTHPVGSSGAYQTIMFELMQSMLDPVIKTETGPHSQSMIIWWKKCSSSSPNPAEHSKI